MCGNPEQYDEQINAWYEMVLQDENEMPVGMQTNCGKNLLVNRESEGLNPHFSRYILNDHIHRSPTYHAFFPGKIIGHIDREKRIFFVRENF